MRKKICVITSARSDYGLLRWVMQGIHESPYLILQIIATGMHLSPEFALTYKAIESDGFYIDRKVEILLSSDTSIGMTKSMGLALIGFADALNELKPDIVLLLGDRFEIHAVATAALVANIPIAHLHGGEITQGAIDDNFRHSITKMSQLHFVATEEYRRRVIQLGEEPINVHLVGGLGIDNIKRLNLLNKEQLENALEFKLFPKNLLITFHPETLAVDPPLEQLNELLAVLSNMKDVGIIFTMSNCDACSRALNNAIEDFVSIHDNSKAFITLGQVVYLSCILHFDGLVGNSSSGVIEAPSFSKGSVNIGERQSGRVQARSVINCDANKEDITRAIETLFSQNFQFELVNMHNPYGSGGASDKIVQILESIDHNKFRTKRFHDIYI